ncbi:MAG TPA: DUF4292 domain-containing protein [Chitinophagaceae bacterium]|nr:DUF4292 domain-containing protein [Chitinophagaceae bacterium]
MMQYLSRILLLALIITAASCKSTRKIQTAISKKDTTGRVVVINDTHADSVKYIQGKVESVMANHIDFKTFGATKLKVNFQDKDGEQPELTVNLRMKKDSIIWVSITATILTVEVFRMKITPDSVILVDKRGKVVHYRSVSYLRELTQLPFDFYTVQDLLIGNPIYFDTAHVISYRKSSQTLQLFSLGDLFKHLMTISDGDNLVQHSKLDDVDPIRSRTCDLTYSGYVNSNGIRFATERQISVSERSKLDVDMNFKQFSFNETLDFKFPIPKNYKRD